MTTRGISSAGQVGSGPTRIVGGDEALRRRGGDGGRAKASTSGRGGGMLGGGCTERGDGAALHVRVRQRLRDRGAGGGAAGGAELAAAAGLRALRRAALGLAVHGAARRQPALLALPHAAVGPACRAVRARSMPGCCARRPTARRASSPIGQLRWAPVPMPERALTFVDGLHTMTTAGDAASAGRHGGALSARHALDAGRLLLDRRRRAAGRAAGRRACAFAPSSA